MGFTEDRTCCLVLWNLPSRRPFVFWSLHVIFYSASPLFLEIYKLRATKPNDQCLGGQEEVYKKAALNLGTWRCSKCGSYTSGQIILCLQSRDYGMVRMLKPSRNSIFRWFRWWFSPFLYLSGNSHVLSMKNNARNGVELEISFLMSEPGHFDSGWYTSKYI